MAHDETTPEIVALREAFNRLAEVLVRRSLPAPHLEADLYETADGTAYVIEVPAAGIRPQDVRILASGDMLTLEVDRKTASEQTARTYLVQEVARGPMARVFTFPTAIDVDRIQARLEHGMLHIRVPKAEGAPSKVIPVEG